MMCTTEAAEADTFNERDGHGDHFDDNSADEDDVSNTFVKKNTFVQAVLADFLQRVPT